MAHFLEHLVFKGGEKYDDYRKVNETAERMGAVLNAYTSHDLVAFHITCRAEVVARRDRPADRLRRAPEDRRRGARPRARRRDPGDRARQRPAVGRRRAPDRPRRVRRPPARAARCSARRSTCARSRARRSSPFRSRQWAGSRGGAFLVGNLEHVPEDARARGPFCRFPSISGTAASSPRRRSRRRRWWRRASPTSRTCGCPTGRRRRARLRAERRRSPSIPRCWAARWARGCSTRSASSAASPTPSTRSTTSSPTCRSSSSPPAWSPASASRPSRACARSSTSCAPTGRSEDEFERATAYAAGRRVLAFENTNAVARHAASQTVVFGRHPPGRRDPGTRRDHIRRRHRGGRAGSPRSSRSPASARILRTNSSEDFPRRRSRTRVHRNITRGFSDRAELGAGARGRPVTKTKGLQLHADLACAQWSAHSRPCADCAGHRGTRSAGASRPRRPSRWTSSCSASTTSTATCSRLPPADAAGGKRLQVTVEVVDGEQLDVLDLAPWRFAWAAGTTMASAVSAKPRMRAPLRAREICMKL